MADYTQNTPFTPKDSLLPGDPNKVILGAELDGEFAELQAVSATKYDSGDIASEAQAVAGLSNEVLMTPLRVSQYVAQGLDSGTANAVASLGALNDPGDDRIVYWDDSGNLINWLDIGTGLEITAGSVLNVVFNTVDHDQLLNYVANEHVNHTAVSPLAGEGLAITGADISASFTYALDIDSLTAITVLDGQNDYFVVYDNDAAGHRKVNTDALLGEAVGDGKWYRNTTTAITNVNTTIIYNTAVNDNLQRGTFSLAGGTYTAGSDGARILVTASVDFPTFAQNNASVIEIQVNGVVKKTRSHRRDPAGGNQNEATTTLVLAAGDVVRVQARLQPGGSSTSAGGEDRCAISIVELA